MKDAKCELCGLLENPEDIAGGVIHVTEYFILIHHQPPVDVKGWLIIVPRRHIEFQQDLTSEELYDLMKLQMKFTARLKELFSPDRIYWVCFSEAVRHIHFHLIPRSADIPEERRGPKIFSRDDAHSLSRDDIEEIIRKLKES